MVNDRTATGTPARRRLDLVVINHVIHRSRKPSGGVIVTVFRRYGAAERPKWRIGGLQPRTQSLTGGWLPQFDLVALRVDHPGELAVLGVVDLLENVAPFRPERPDKSVNVVDAV